ncbi:hypothetical protein [Sphingomonas sp. G-3-2-10]|uniref:hypothetical protein n=1 Tax=Sphingomonas sp. G-3-2-10 TaxID=2728838 RepID=UPI00146D8C8E|nr:hypothetical protein [Sphingomonas sp. G-3-2-10]NML06107.1 hypothetical protein [Sphingomonas sp. G-3-2-10]
MQAIRIAAIAALAAVAALAVRAAFDDGAGLSVGGWALLSLLLIAAANAVGVLLSIRERRPYARMQMTGLWLVAGGVGCALLICSSPIWIGLIVAPSFLNIGQLVVAGYSSFILALLGLLALMSGWALWVVSRPRKQVCAA